jgi:hypothetical protein
MILVKKNDILWKNDFIELFMKKNVLQVMCEEH